MDEFRRAMDPVNDIAKATPGFCWSLDHVTPNQRHAVPLLRDDPLLQPQLSLWMNMESLQHFAFKSGHAMYLKRRKEWFTSPADPPWAVCWWREASRQDYPTLQEAFERLQALKQNGPTEKAFDFKTHKDFPMPVME